MEVRSLIKEVESQKKDIKEALESIKEKKEFLELYIKRNPSEISSFINYYDILNINIQVEMFPMVLSFTDNVKFHNMLAEKYLNQITEFSKLIIHKTLAPETVSKILIKNFNEYELLDDEFDGYNCSNLQEYILKYGKDIYNLITIGVEKRLTEFNNNMYKRGVKIVQILCNFDEISQFKNKENSENLSSDEIDEKLSKMTLSEGLDIENPSKNEKPIPGYDNLNIKEKTFTPYSLQECLITLKKAKHINRMEVALQKMNFLIEKTTKRMLKRVGYSLFETLMNCFEDRIKNFEFLKRKILKSLLVHDFDNIFKYYIDSIFTNEGLIIKRIYCLEALTVSLNEINLVEAIKMCDYFQKSLNEKGVSVKDKKLMIFMYNFIDILSLRGEESIQITTNCKQMFSFMLNRPSKYHIN